MTEKLRFSIFERDNFTCQYCGRKPPEVVLHVDHMISKYDGGGDDEINLITSCSKCNLGKSKKSVNLQKKKNTTFKKELSVIEEQKKQLLAYYSFVKKKEESYDDQIRVYTDRMSELSGFKTELGPIARRSMIRAINQFSMDEVFYAMDVSWGNASIQIEDKLRYMFGVLKHIKEDKINT